MIKYIKKMEKIIKATFATDTDSAVSARLAAHELYREGFRHAPTLVGKIFETLREELEDGADANQIVALLKMYEKHLLDN